MIAIDSSHTYTLPELIDLAESHNPATRLAWERSKVQAAQLGISKSALYPSVTAVALAATTRTGVLLGAGWHRQTEGIFEPQLEVDYMVFDFGSRLDRVDVSRANLLRADTEFNETHLRVIFQTTAGYYRVLNAEGLTLAARANLTNAQTIQQAVEERLQHGLATLPDALEARSATAQSEYDLQTAIGLEETARGDLLTVVSASPAASLQLEGIEHLPVPETMAEPFDALVKRAFEQRPDLLAQFEQLRAAKAEIRDAKSSFLPTLNFRGQGGAAHAYGQQDLLPDTYVPLSEVWNVQTELRWNLFDGGRRKSALASAESERRAALDEIDRSRDDIANQVWTAYSNAQTALRQRQAAAALLAASSESYDASLEAYKYGVRSLLDVVAAQRILAQARAADITARTQVLTQFSTLAFRTADLLNSAPATAASPNGQRP
jgi:outer membrane protein TolC